MNINNWLLINECPDLLHFKLKTARQKRRNYKEDFKKRLIQLVEDEQEIQLKISELPLVPLKTPIQRGWVRYFVLREDVRESGHADFYTDFLKKINVYMYSNNKTFAKKRRKKSKKYIVITPQTFVNYDESTWQRISKKFSDREKEHFVPKIFWDSVNKCELIRYVFDEPWRYVLRIRPYLITHTRTIDLDLESQLAKIKNHIQNNFLRSKICRIVYGEKSNYKSFKPNSNPLRNKTLVSIMNEYQEEIN